MRQHRLNSILLTLALLVAACGQLVGDSGPAPLVITATVERTANLFIGSDVRVLGLAVGEVTDITPLGDVVDIELTLDGERDYPADVNIRLTPISLLGERFAALDPPYTGGDLLADGDHVPLGRTGVPAEVDEVLRSFEDFLAALDGDTLAELIDVLADTLDGNGEGLNELIGNGADTVRVLADSSGDLNQVVSDLADLNETLATRQETIGTTLVETSELLRNLQEDRDLLIGALSELERAVGELAPVVDTHGDNLVRDLDTLATTLSTVDRNLDRIGTALFGSNRLFTGSGRIIEWENARLPLDNEAGSLANAASTRVAERLVGLCLRLELTDCDSLEEVLDQLPDICLPGLCADPEGGMSLGQAIGVALAGLPAEDRQVLAEELAAQQEAEAAQDPSPSGLPPADDRLSGRGSVPGEDDGQSDDEDPIIPDLPLIGGDQ